MYMDYLSIKKRFHSNAALPSPFIPGEIIAEILCLLPVKTIVQLRCVRKAWKIRISDPAFIQKHFNSSSQNSHLLFTTLKSICLLSSVKSFRVVRLLDADRPMMVSTGSFHGLMDDCQIVGSCKGLLCLFFWKDQSYCFILCNPATRTLSEKLWISQDYGTIYNYSLFTFGCDISTGTYKVVIVTLSNFIHQFKVVSLGDNSLRTFQYGSSIPVCLIYGLNKRTNNGVHLNGTVNWLALPKYIKQSYEYNWKSIANAQHFVILSLDLSSETCTQFLLPPGFNEVPCFQPALNVLMECLIFSHDLKGSEYVIWQMKEFGVQDSWTMLFKINYIDIQIHNYLSEIDTHLLPLYLSKNGDTCILANYEDDQVVIYNQREKIVRTIRMANKLCWLSDMEYVESLVSTC